MICFLKFLCSIRHYITLKLYYDVIMSVSLTVDKSSDGHLTVRRACIELFRLAGPAAISFCATALSNTLSFVFIGRHTNEVIQASHALGYSVGNIMVLMVGLGYAIRLFDEFYCVLRSFL